jgi:hypothetical protein
VPLLTLVVETPTGTYLRPIRPATVLPTGMGAGDGAEHATRSAAAYWGMPDFVFRPRQQSRGSASREIGDAILVVGGMAASVQVKAREAPSGNDRRERSWLDKRVAEASRQARGTIRRVKSAETVLINQRGKEVSINGPEKTWLPVVVLDHAGVDDYMPQTDAVVLLRRDWEFLFEQLKSTYAVLEYLLRVSRTEPVALGLEPMRYYEMAAADAGMPPSPLDPRLASINLTDFGSTPMLPQAPAGHGDQKHHLLIRAILEDIATVPLKADGVTYADLLEVLACVDSMPVGYRAQLGRVVLEWFEKLAKLPPNGGITWFFRGMIWQERPYLLIGAANRYSSILVDALSNFVALRHQQHLDVLPERANIMTVGVVLTPRQDGEGWDTTMAASSGEHVLADEDRTILEGLFGRLGEHLVGPGNNL